MIDKSFSNKDKQTRLSTSSIKLTTQNQKRKTLAEIENNVENNMKISETSNSEIFTQGFRNLHRIHGKSLTNN